MNKRNIESVYALSPMQQGMLFHSIQAPESDVYVEQLTCTLRGDLNVAAFHHAWYQVIERHAILRTAFVWKRIDKMLQVVQRQVELPLEQQDWRTCSSPEQEEKLAAIIIADRRRGFKLSEAPLMQLTLLRLADQVFKFIMTHHHLLLDGWSLPLLMKEVFAFYEANCQGQELHLPPARPFRDYITWLHQQDLEKAKTYWQTLLKGFIAPTPLVVDRIVENEKNKPGRYEELVTDLPGETTTKLQIFARQNNLTINTLVQAAWGLLLLRYSGEDDVIFGATVSGRPAELDGIESMVGLFINTLPVRLVLDRGDTVLSLLKRLQEQQVQTREYEYSPLVQVQRWSDVPGNQPLFDSILVFENYPVDLTLQQRQFSLQIQDIGSIEHTNYPLSVIASLYQKFSLKISYNCDRFDRATIQRMLGHLKTMLAAIPEMAHQNPVRLPMLTDNEWQCQVIQWNQTTGDYPQNWCLHQLFEQQAAKTPEAIAIIYNNRTLTYRQLNQQSTQLALYLQKCGIGPDLSVGICLERSPEMMIAVLAVLKANGAYLPLDPSYPHERIAFMLNDAQVPILLTQKSLLEKLPAVNIRTICLDADREQIDRECAKNPEQLKDDTTPANLAYIIYTSGSTGQPKGTMVNHSGVINFCHAAQKDWKIPANSCILQFASISFDASVAEIFLAILTGNTLVLADKDTILSIDALIQLMRDQNITAAILPPSLLALLPDDNLPDLQLVISAGESCSWEIANRWRQKCRFINGYGPTEATVGCSWCTVADNVQTVTVPIGKPIANVQIYLLDKHLNPAPVAVPGELHIGGIGLARGYLNQPGLTAERFIPNPFSQQPGTRLYKSGDLARYLPNGAIEFIGRIDFQVKIRGFRIELGEIEAVLQGHPAVQECVVLAREDSPGDKRLVAYIIENKNYPTNASELRGYCQQRLPEYLVPTAFMTLATLPLTPNGKIDRKCLPQPEQLRPGLLVDYVAARNPIEAALVTTWQEILNLERIGIHDNFFELGGHSLLAIQLLSRIRNIFNIELPVREIFTTPTIAELARKINDASRSLAGLSIPPITPFKRVPGIDVPLSFAQQRLWFLEQLVPEKGFYNIPAAIRLEGELNAPALEQCLVEMIRRHESLRTFFTSVAGKSKQMIMPDPEFRLQKLDLSSYPVTEKEAEAYRLAVEEARRPFNLARGPLFRAMLIRLEQNTHIILVTMHHIISDGWSVGVLSRELATLYTAFSAGKPAPLPDLPIQYPDFAHWQRQWFQGQVLASQIQYWRQQLANCAPILELPTDHPRPAIQSFNGAHHNFRISKELTRALHAFSRTEGSTLFMTLLAAFQTLLYRYSGQVDICVGIPVANRTYQETEDLIGFFVNTLVLRTNFSGNPGFQELLKQVQEVTMTAFAHQDLPFEKLVEALQPDRDLSHTPLFQVMFVFQNMPGQTLTLPNLTFTPLEVESGIAKFDLTLVMAEDSNGISASFEYNTDLFAASTITRIVGHFQTLLNNIVTNPAQSISALSILTPAEWDELKKWNDSAVAYPQDLCFHQLFETQAEKTPETPALLFAEEQLTYRSLNQRANRLAHYLQKQGVQPDVMVGICMDRSIEMVTGILAILKAGGAYVPLDPHYPKERLACMIEDSQISVLLTQSKLSSRLPAHSAKEICLDMDWQTILQESDDNVMCQVTPANLAYVIFTSGSTGKPKGVMLSHQGLSNLSEAQLYAFNLSTGNRVLQFSPLSFDASVWEIIMALRAGATLCLTSQEQLLPGPDLVQLLRQHDINTITLPPSILAALPPDQIPSLETIIAAGEALPGELVNHWSQGRRFFNAYGPTEVTVCASYQLCHNDDQQIPSIGRAISNTQLYVLDCHLNPVPVGVPGELHVAGPGLARGYLNRPDLTAEKFIPNPFCNEPGKRLYKTGDLVRRRPGGDLEFMGRIDHQVKVRGFRIELGEVEAVLGKHPEIKEVVVTAAANSYDARSLVAYLVANQGTKPTTGELRNFLKKELPEYMIPSTFVLLDSFPLFPSGKIDRTRLPAPDGKKLTADREYVAPRNKTDIMLATTCAEILQRDQVGIYDNFFEIGGHSLVATQFIARIREKFNIELPLRILFEKPTIAELTEEIEKYQKTHSGVEIDKIGATTRGKQHVMDLFTELAQLSDDETRVLLTKEMEL